MSDNSQQVDQTKEEQPKNTIKLFGRYVPTWIVVLGVIILIWIVWHMWSEHQKQSIGLTSSTRANLDKLAASSADTASAGIRLSTPSTEETRKQLNKLFNSF